MSWHPLIDSLLLLLTDERKQRLLNALNQRSRHLTIILEDLFHPHNSNAVVRSAECFGLQDVYVIENENEFQTSKGVNLGSSKWIDVHRFNEAGKANTRTCIEHLRSKGYLIAAASPHATALNLAELPAGKKLALMFGREKLGLSKTAIEHADFTFKIPMFGLTESFNISVSAAICMHHLSAQFRQMKPAVWSLNPEEKQDLLYRWLKDSIRGFEELEAGLIAKGLPPFN